MHWGSFWIGALAVPVIGGVVTWLCNWVLSIQRLRRGGLGKGYVHDVERHFADEGWGRVQHTHQWPGKTPWWVIRAAEPIRVRACLRLPDYRPVAK